MHDLHELGAGALSVVGSPDVAADDEPGGTQLPLRQELAADLRLAVGRRLAASDAIVVEWTTDYGDGRLGRSVSNAELHNGEAVWVTNYWARRSRHRLSERPSQSRWKFPERPVAVGR